MSLSKCEMCTFNNPTGSLNCQMCNLPINQSGIEEQLDKALKEITIQKNYELAYQTIPESFIPIEMLYFDCLINGFPVKAFIDTGAQSSIMNFTLAKKIGCADLIDQKYKGKAVGVGSQKIYGKIHLLDIEIVEKNICLPCSFLILKKMDIDIIFGLNMLMSHGVILDLKNKYMIINDIHINFCKKN